MSQSKKSIKNSGHNPTSPSNTSLIAAQWSGPIPPPADLHAIALQTNDQLEYDKSIAELESQLAI